MTPLILRALSQPRTGTSGFGRETRLSRCLPPRQSLTYLPGTGYSKWDAETVTFSASWSAPVLPAPWSAWTCTAKASTMRAAGQPVPLVQGDVRKSPFGKTFQVIGIFDVLEHIPDDNRILVDLWELLENGGTLLLTVPANPSLWSYFDELAGHCRRYEAGGLRSKLEKAGFAIEYLTPFMASLSPLMWLSRAFRAKKAANADAKALLEQELRVVPVLNEILAWALSWETRWLAKRRQLPFGSSLLAVARKQAPA